MIQQDLNKMAVCFVNMSVNNHPIITKTTDEYQTTKGDYKRVKNKPDKTRQVQTNYQKAHE